MARPVEVEIAGQRLRLRWVKGKGLQADADLEAEALAGQVSGRSNPISEFCRALAEELSQTPRVKLADRLRPFRASEANRELDLNDPLELVLLSCLDDPGQRLLAASSPATPGFVLERMALDPDRAVVEALAFNPGLPENGVERLLRNPNRKVLEALAASPATPVRILLRMHEELPQMHSKLARNPALPEQLLEAFARSNEDEFRLAAALNPGLPDRLVRELAKDPSPQTRSAVALRTECPPDLMEQLAKDPSSSVRWHLVVYREQPPPRQLLEEIAASPDIWLAEQARRLLEEPPQLQV